MRGRRDWQSLSQLGANRLQLQAAFDYYEELPDLCQPDWSQSYGYLSLSGSWNFAYYTALERVPQDFDQAFKACQ